jgi:hypothetical protein
LSGNDPHGDPSPSIHGRHELVERPENDDTWGGGVDKPDNARAVLCKATVGTGVEQEVIQRLSPIAAAVLVPRFPAAQKA